MTNSVPLCVCFYCIGSVFEILVILKKQSLSQPDALEMVDQNLTVSTTSILTHQSSYVPIYQSLPVVLISLLCLWTISLRFILQKSLVVPGE